MKIENKIKLLDDNELENITAGVTKKAVAREVIKGGATIVGIIGGGLAVLVTAIQAKDFIVPESGEIKRSNFGQEHPNILAGLAYSCEIATLAVSMITTGVIGYEFGKWLTKKFDLEEN